jgi:hypothetical protein
MRAHDRTIAIGVPFTEAQLEAADSRLLRLTRCMRAHGYPDWPDPIVNANDVGFLPPRGVNMKDPSPRLQAAELACLCRPRRDGRDN